MAWMFGGRDKAQEAEVQHWIETVTEEQWPADVEYSEYLRSGVALCKLMNRLSPGSVKRINTSGLSFNYMDNVHNFLDAAVAYGVSEVDLFQGSDLFQGHNIERVTRAVQAVAREAHRHPEYQGPLMGPRPSQQNVRHFDQETLAAGRATLSQQTGYNRGASQAGQSFGKPRRIVIGK